MLLEKGIKPPPPPITLETANKTSAIDHDFFSTLYMDYGEYIDYPSKNLGFCVSGSELSSDKGRVMSRGEIVCG